jgi:hypothetical protein
MLQELLRSPSMALLLLAIMALVVLCVVYVTVPAMVETFRALSGPRLVTCPTSGNVAEVELDARLGALTSAIGSTRLRVKSCVYWPGHGGCDQGCIVAIDPLDAQRHGLLARPFRMRRSEPGKRN